MGSGVSKASTTQDKLPESAEKRDSGIDVNSPQSPDSGTLSSCGKLDKNEPTSNITSSTKPSVRIANPNNAKSPVSPIKETSNPLPVLPKNAVKRTPLKMKSPMVKKNTKPMQQSPVQKAEKKIDVLEGYKQQPLQQQSDALTKKNEGDWDLSLSKSGEVNVNKNIRGLKKKFGTFKYDQGGEECVFKDGDGDLYVCNWKTQTIKPFPSKNRDNGRLIMPSIDYKTEIPALSLKSPLLISDSDNITPIEYFTFIDKNGHFLSALIPTRHFLRVCFNPTTNMWTPMSLIQESTIEPVKEMLDTIQQFTTDDRLSILQRLRDCSYSVKAVIKEYQVRDVVERKALENFVDNYCESDPTSKNFVSPEIAKRDKKIEQLQQQLEHAQRTFQQRNAEVEANQQIQSQLEIKVGELQDKEKVEGNSRVNYDEMLLNAQNSITDLNNRVKELLMEVDVLKNGTDRDMYDFKNAIMSEKEQHIDRLRGKIAEQQNIIRDKEKSQLGKTRKMERAIESVHKIKRDHIRLNHEIKRSFADIKNFINYNLANVATSRLSSLTQSYEQMYMKEQFEQYSKKIAWQQTDLMRGRVRVFARIMPPELMDKRIVSESRRGSEKNSISVISETELSLFSGEKESLVSYQFDRVFASKTSQQEIYCQLMNIVPGILNGLHVGLFAFGQSKTGKSNTIHGSIGNEGMIQRSLKDLYACISKRKGEKAEAYVFITACDVYNEQVFDIFSNNYDPIPASEKLNKDGSPQVDIPLQKVACKTYTEAINVLGRIFSTRKQLATVKKRSFQDSSYVIKFHVSVIGNSGIVEGSLTITDISKFEECVDTLDKHQVQDSNSILETLSINYTTSSIAKSLAACNSYRSKPNNYKGSNEMLSLIIADCFGANGRNFVFLHLSPYVVDYKIAVATCEFGKAILTSSS